MAGVFAVSCCRLPWRYTFLRWNRLVKPSCALQIIGPGSEVHSQLLQATLAIHCFLRWNPLARPSCALLFTAAGSEDWDVEKAQNAHPSWAKPRSAEALPGGVRMQNQAKVGDCFRFCWFLSRVYHVLKPNKNDIYFFSFCIYILWLIDSTSVILDWYLPSPCLFHQTRRQPHATETILWKQRMGILTSSSSYF